MGADSLRRAVLPNHTFGCVTRLLGLPKRQPRHGSLSPGAQEDTEAQAEPDDQWKVVRKAGQGWAWAEPPAVFIRGGKGTGTWCHLQLGSRVGKGGSLHKEMDGWMEG